jgi:hypothetical protein
VVELAVLDGIAHEPGVALGDDHEWVLVDDELLERRALLKSSEHLLTLRTGHLPSNVGELALPSRHVEGLEVAEVRAIGRAQVQEGLADVVGPLARARCILRSRSKVFWKSLSLSRFAWSTSSAGMVACSTRRLDALVKTECTACGCDAIV